MIDRTTKFLLLAIGLGLWANIAALTIRPAMAQHQDTALTDIAGDVHDIAEGNCTNRKIC